MPLFLFITTLIVGGAFANEGGHKAVEDHGVKSSVERLWENRKPLDYSKLND